MTQIIATLKNRLDAHSRFRRTLRELRAMPLDVALDLELNPAEFRRIAAEAVYGPARA
ncbi:hypothetical protein GCM10011415_03110 [Salipiger pallidus]|uniref:Uncharacterized protein n=1 Tax=Salipiger pallidus TaxID=1775170 RepID=A0A8J2ZGA9_9RHOB|nr:hypothetical protein [Salipiger pallidus]GGG60552.1 hypothetical protein GCM10011415_03110 [Salipiger pallidus]